MSAPVYKWTPLTVRSASLAALEKLDAQMRGRANIPLPIPPEALRRYRAESVRLIVAANRELTSAPN